jgi:hypothetical protein
MKNVDGSFILSSKSKQPTPTPRIKHMKSTLSVYEIADALQDDSNANWSYEGSKALAEYLNEIDEQSGEDTELDVVAIRCDWSEYQSAQDAASNYSWEYEGDEEDIDPEELDELKEDSALEYLQDRTQVIEFNGGIIIADF